MPRSGRGWVLFSIGIQVVWSLPLAVLFGYKWLAKNEPNVTSSCLGDDGGTATCFSGETVNRILTLVFGLIALVALVIFVYCWRKWRAADADQAKLAQTGMRIAGLVTGVQTTSMWINNRPVYKVICEARPSGMAPIVVSQKTTTPPATGTQVTIAFDPNNPKDAAVLDDFKAMTAQATAVNMDAAFSALQNGQVPQATPQMAQFTTMNPGMQQAASAALDQALANGQITQQQHDLAKASLGQSFGTVPPAPPPPMD